MKVFALVLFALAVVHGEHFSVLFEKGAWVVKSGNHFLEAVAVAEWKDTRTEDGWTRLQVTINDKKKMSDTEKFYGAGYLEGYITQHLIFAGYYNYANGTGLPFSSAMVTLANNQDTWMRAQVKAHTSDSYWQKVGLAQSQYDGIMAGYAAIAPAAETLSRIQLLAYALQFEIGDYAMATKTSMSHAAFKTTQGRRKLIGEHCSVIFKLPNNQQDLLSSHITWSGFNTMLRVFKKYVFPTGTVSFSSYPGLPYSGDDWFINSHKLVIVETTNEIFNTTLYKFLTAQTVPYYIRVQVANTAETAPQWHQLFQRFNNGAYNNQWMVADYKLFTPGKALVNNTFVVGEQAPGLYHFEDQSQYLQTNRYWSSYNVPFYNSVWMYSGYLPMYQKYGNAYSWSMCARAQIYRRDEGAVQTVADVQRIQRYNRYQVDDKSLQDACRGIAARCDLNTPWSNNTLNGMMAFGAIDCKIANSDRVKKMQTLAVSGPTYDSQPIFHWSQQWKYVPHLELPKVYNFPFVEIKW